METTEKQLICQVNQARSTYELYIDIEVTYSISRSIYIPMSSYTDQGAIPDRTFESNLDPDSPPIKVVSEFKPAGDQPNAIKELVAGLNNGETDQVLLGVTGSGKTFTMAHVIEQTQRPTLIMAPNKTLAAQLYEEMKAFFPDNAVEYFVSYYDYYQP